MSATAASVDVIANDADVKIEALCQAQKRA
jgi:hypothetical protein